MARRCACGLPQVIETHPRLDDGTPFPTLWWLTCIQLSRAVSRLESEGLMADINQVLINDPEIRDRLGAATERYLAARDALKKLEEGSHPGGGPYRIKCLHAHTAHHLITGDNPVGATVLNQLSWEDPSTPCLRE